jgi:cytoskeleton protein RodZ
MFELGNNLREARQHRRIDLVIAEQDTKIRSKYLAALETEDFEVLPGPVFVRGFLRTYSRYLGLDPQLFIEEYNARFGRFEDLEDHQQHSPALGRPGLAHARELRGRRTMRTAIVATLVAVAALAYLGLHQGQHMAAPADRSAASSAPVTQTITDPTGALGAAATVAHTNAAAKPMTPYAQAAQAFRAKRAAAQAKTAAAQRFAAHR